MTGTSLKYLDNWILLVSICRHGSSKRTEASCSIGEGNTQNSNYPFHGFIGSIELHVEIQ